MASAQLPRYGFNEKVIVIDRTDAHSKLSPFHLIFENQSSATWSFVVYQSSKDRLPTQSKMLAWMSQKAAPQTAIKYSWSPEYSFVWSQTGELTNASTIFANQVYPTELTGSDNRITLLKNTDGAYQFSQPSPGAPPDAYIGASAAIPGQTLSVGIGIAKVPVLIAQAQPSVVLTFVPSFSTCIGFGQNIAKGQVLGSNSLNGPTQITYPANKYTATATLSQSNTWSISYEP